MLTAESSGSVLANVTPLDSGATAVNSAGAGGGVARQAASATVSAKSLRKGRQYSVKTFSSLGLTLLFVTLGCRERPIDQGALITARTVGLDDLQRGRLDEAEREFKRVIAIAPREPLGYANLGLTYLRAGRFGEAESQLERARRLDTTNVDVVLTLTKLYSLTNRSAEAHQLLTPFATDPRALYALAELERESGDSGQQRYAMRLGQVQGRAPANLAVRLQLADVLLTLGESDSTLRYLEAFRQLRPEPPREAKPHLNAAIQELGAGNLGAARAEFDRFLRLMEVTAPYQTALAKVSWTEGPLVGRPVIAFNPASLITMRGIAPAADSVIQFTDVTTETGLPDVGAAPTALALGDGDGEDNLLIASPQVRLYALRKGFVADARTRMTLRLPVGAVSATFADYDNDGWLDVFVIGTDGRGYLFHNRDGKRFEDVTKTAGVSDVDGARRALFVDLDHDGDLDLLLVGGKSLAVYRNNLDGTFTLAPNADGIVQGGTDAVFGDLDDDGRTDVFVASEAGLDGLFHNDGVRGFTRTADTIRGDGPVAIGDYDNDGALDLFVAGSGFWHNDGSGRFARDGRSRAVLERIRTISPTSATFLDYDNDGWLDLLVTGARGAALFHNDRAGRFEDRSTLLPPDMRRDSIGPVLVADFDGDGDQDILFGDRTGVHLLRNDGGNAHLGMQVQLTALRAGSGKNNTFGIGSRLEVRAGELYQTRVVTSRVTPFGLGSHFKADVLRVQWTNGVPQTIYFPGTDQDVLEMQQLKGSCAFLYTWDGTHFRFITDIMWQSALGMPVGIMGKGDGGRGKGPMAYAPAGASREYVRIPGEALQPRNGRYVVQVTEELWETAYLDQLRLLAVDHPDSVEVFVDERFPPSSASDQLHLLPVIRRRPPLSAVDEQGRDVLAELRDHDFRYVSDLTPLGYQGLTKPHALILDLDAAAGAPGTVLMLRGWIFPSDASINVALSQQRKLRAEPPILEVRDARGRWMSRGGVGFPAGKDKTMVIDLAGIFPTRDQHVRLRTNLQIYWDQAFVADTARSLEPGVRRLRITTLAPVSGLLHYRGFSRMYRRGGRYGPQWFAYDDVRKESPWRPITGAATRFGDVTPLLDDHDDQYVIMVPGDETTVEFDAGSLRALPPGWTRTFLLYSDGWIKDSDLNTAHGTTVGPLPYHSITSYPYAPGDAYPTDSARQRYLRAYNTRIIRPPPGAREER